MKFKNRLLELRKERNISQKELAFSLGITTGAVANYEVGSRTPRVNDLIKMADFFGVSIDYLLGRTNNPTIPMVELAFKGMPLELQEKLLDEKTGLPYIRLAAEFLETDIPAEELREYVSVLAKVRRSKTEREELKNEIKRYK